MPASCFICAGEPRAPERLPLGEEHEQLLGRIEPWRGISLSKIKSTPLTLLLTPLTLLRDAAHAAGFFARLRPQGELLTCSATILQHTPS